MTIRLDKFLSNKYKNYSRNKLRHFISSDCATVNGKIQNKPSFLVDESDDIKLNIKDAWVSRGAYKLLKAIEYFHISLNDKICLDIGCSTGGFSQVMLKHNAKKIYAVDVGTNQFDKTLYCNKIVLREKTHFCSTKTSDFEKIDFIACDVSFISATKIIEHINKIFKYPLSFVCLIKPQFELTKEILDKCKGLIPIKYHKQAISKVCSSAKRCGFNVGEVIQSPILGAKSNNIEYLVYLEKK